jgi:uncharacterized phage protein (TIGR02218 family)
VRNWPAALIAHLQQPVTTTCRLMRVTLYDGRVYGLAELDIDIIYQGVLYSAIRGFDPSVIATDSGLSVDNGEIRALLADDPDEGITAQMIEAGELDDAEWVLMLVNWGDLSIGHGVIDAGDIGEVRLGEDGSYTIEALSYTARLHQPIGTLTSRTCRAVFGTPAIGQTGCGYNAELLWATATVTGVSDEEPRRLFSSTGATGRVGLIPGRVQWLTGRNSGRNRLYQIDAYGQASGTFGLIEQTPRDIEAGDTFRFRPDCDKTKDYCKAYGNLLNFKGEPYIPVGDGLESQTPGAQISGGVLGSEVIE